MHNDDHDRASLLWPRYIRIAAARLSSGIEEGLEEGLKSVPRRLGSWDQPNGCQIYRRAPDGRSP